MQANIGMVSLGCPKALVDSEHILTQLRTEGYQIVPDYQSADLVIVNTCGFIDSAVIESLDAIGEALEENGKVIVTGCLGARADEILAEYPNVLAITGPHALSEVLTAVHQHLPRPHNPFTDLVPPQGVKLTPRHYSYLKISEGCNHRCTFCIIPSLRGDLQSYPVDDVLKQAEKLVEAGSKELLVIAQDTSAYGVDVKYRTGFWNGRPVKTRMYELCNQLSQLGAWVRLHYVYPYPHVDEVIPLMAEGKILPYLDIPLQHSVPHILKMMKRPANAENTLARLNRWREICPEITFRSTFIVGFPGETEQDFQQLLDFLTEAQLDRVGAFAYSSIQGAAANDLPNQVAEEEKQLRLARFMEHQAQISANKLAARLGKICTVLVDEHTADGFAIARSSADAPEIDGVVFIENGLHLPVGEFANVRIIDHDEHDVWGEVL